MNDTKILYGSPRFAVKTREEWETIDNNLYQKNNQGLVLGAGEVIYVKEYTNEDIQFIHPCVGDGITRYSFLPNINPWIRINTNLKYIAIGKNNIEITNSVVLGDSNTYNSFTNIIGQNNSKNIASVIIGSHNIGSDDTDNQNNIIIGNTNKGQNSIIVGNSNISKQSVILGNNIKFDAESTYNIAIGGNLDETSSSIQHSLIIQSAYNSNMDTQRSIIIGSINGYKNDQTIAIGNSNRGNISLIIGSTNENQSGAKITTVVGSSNVLQGSEYLSVIGVSNKIRPKHRSILIIGGANGCGIEGEDNFNNQVNDNVLIIGTGNSSAVRSSNSLLVGSSLTNYGQDCLLVGSRNSNIYENKLTTGPNAGEPQYCNRVALIGTGLYANGSNALMVGTYNEQPKLNGNPADDSPKQLRFVVACGTEAQPRNSLSVNTYGRINVPLDPERSKTGHSLTLDTALPLWAVVHLIKWGVAGLGYYDIIQHLNNTQRPEGD